MDLCLRPPDPPSPPPAAVSGEQQTRCLLAACWFTSSKPAASLAPATAPPIRAPSPLATALTWVCRGAAERRCRQTHRPPLRPPPAGPPCYLAAVGSLACLPWAVCARAGVWTPPPWCCSRRAPPQLPGPKSGSCWACRRPARGPSARGTPACRARSGVGQDARAAVGSHRCGPPARAGASGGRFRRRFRFSLTS